MALQSKELYVLDLQELSVINAIPRAYGYQDRATIVHSAVSFLNDRRFDDRVANALVDRMIKNKLLEKVRSYIGVTELGYREYASAVAKLRELSFKFF